MKVALSFNRVSTSCSYPDFEEWLAKEELAKSLAPESEPESWADDDLSDLFEQIYASISQTDRASTKSAYGQVHLTYRSEGRDQFSVVWLNRMTMASIALHKFRKGAYVVELSSPAGKLDVLNFKSIEPAASFALLNTDVTRIADENARKARGAFVGYISSTEGRARDVLLTCPKGCWELNKLRGTDIKFTDAGQDFVGRLQFIAPGGKKVMITRMDDSGNWARHIVDTRNVWVN